MRNASDSLFVFPIGHDYACVARSDATPKSAVLLRVVGPKVTAVRLVICPALLQELGILMTANSAMLI